jgi:hypothetical protein
VSRNVCHSRIAQQVAAHTARVAVAIATLASLAPPAIADAGAAGDEFSADELVRLERGELLQRRATSERGDLRLIGGTSWQVIDASPDAVWRALLDTAHYPRMLPQVSEAKLVRQAGEDRTLYLRHGGAIAPTSYYLDVHVERATRSITFHIDESRPSSIRAASGFYSLRPYRGRSLLVYGVMADIGDGLLSAVFRPTVHDWMMKVPLLVKRFVEGSGRELYSMADARR